MKTTQEEAREWYKEDSSLRLHNDVVFESDSPMHEYAIKDLVYFHNHMKAKEGEVDPYELNRKRERIFRKAELEPDTPSPKQGMSAEEFYNTIWKTNPRKSLEDCWEFAEAYASKIEAEIENKVNEHMAEFVSSTPEMASAYLKSQGITDAYIEKGLAEIQEMIKNAKSKLKR